MKPSCKFLSAVAITALSLALAGCQQAPPTAAATPAQATPAPNTTTESSSSTRSVEVKSDPSNPDAPAGKTIVRESTTQKTQQ